MGTPSGAAPSDAASPPRSALSHREWRRQWAAPLRDDNTSGPLVLDDATGDVARVVCEALAIVVRSARDERGEARPQDARLDPCLDERWTPLASDGVASFRLPFVPKLRGLPLRAVSSRAFCAASLEDFVDALVCLGALDVDDLVLLVMYVEKVERARPGVLRPWTVRPVLLAAASLLIRTSEDGMLGTDVVHEWLRPLLPSNATARQLAQREAALLATVDWALPTDGATFDLYAQTLHGLSDALRTRPTTAAAAA